MADVEGAGWLRCAPLVIGERSDGGVSLILPREGTTPRAALAPMLARPGIVRAGLASVYEVQQRCAAGQG